MRWGAGSVTGDTTRAAVLALLGRHGPLSRAEVAERLSLSPATVTQLTRRLLAQGLVTELGQRPSQGGRPAIMVGIVPTAAHALGVQVASEHVSGVLTQADAEIIDRFHRPFDPFVADAVDNLIGIIDRQLDKARQRGQPLMGVGVAVPGIVDPVTGTLRMSVRLGWHGEPLAARLRDALDLPVLVDNDISALTATERWYGRGGDWSDFLVVAIGQGVGLGMVLDGAPYRGAAGAAGEFGHVPLVADGQPCSCGNRGCLETLVSSGALVRQAASAGAVPAEADLDELRLAAVAGDPRVREVLATAGHTLGRALAGVVNLLGPEAVLVVGEIAVVWEFLADAFDAALRGSVLDCLRATPVEVRDWDDGAIAFGAAGIVLAAPLAVPRQASSGIAYRG
jgi:predicted NBD/HSP70 family sugar kinase